jgi:D-alanyl-D-alanine carboxypeptidase/D-alanyl-D-alanine-endopeptidase (penicillin-binding protein 4)
VVVIAAAACSAGQASVDPVDRADRAGHADAPATTGSVDHSAAERDAQASRPRPLPRAADASPCPEHLDRPAPGQGDLAAVATAALEPYLGDPRFGGLDVGASVWIEGLGEVVAHAPDARLLPASNQKLATAVAALDVLGSQHRLTTVVRRRGAVRDGTVRGDLAIVGGGDPTITSAGPHSLDALAARVADAGVVTVTGDLLVEEHRFDAHRAAPGWFDWHVPAYIGPLSALVVDRNQARTDAEFLADPSRAHAEQLVDALAAHGVTVLGRVRDGRATGAAVASLVSPTVGELVQSMLRESDNLIAEMLVREVGRVATARGSTPAGTAVVDETVDALVGSCSDVTGRSADGSGLSRLNARSATGWRRILQAAAEEPWWPVLGSGLPVAGVSGTLAGRLTGPSTAGNVTAKTGSILEGRALSGFLTTAGGRRAVFSVLVNGDAPGTAGAATGAIDAFVEATAQLQL